MTSGALAAAGKSCAGSNFSLGCRLEVCLLAGPGGSRARRGQGQACADVTENDG